MQNLPVLFVVFLKFLIPTFLLKFPFYASWSNYFLDVVDGDILRSLGMGEYPYQMIDKLADFYSYFFMMFLGLRFRIKNTVVILFIYRAVGQILFFLTRNELVFFYFQNFLEPLIMTYTLLLFKLKSEKKAYKTYKNYLKLIWGIIFAYKIWNEWTLHFANVDLSKKFLGFTGGE
ncbi:hypothetical protein A2686_00880 [Candidatus Woesebacteria bacterium RIFCSPHIGHO2_01_FULL_38_10]|uniref:Uncharacterized protein n=1 Tax=Candidatus Woesebacteria bacterium RIFCSPLOWO2_01_FULL_39_10b TaxID=1802517 RepID=A0A1F8B9F0_9BACT|nr:MAG: hypothetical protein A2686_00880 [Candidatus Woesebacteria bacterium RIFCSPHIGHO2_01_FULL_38_10]OGM60661.1 MAG: hypothetical protein A2892_01275 [Candidatus Woesebacteria bacterium RIFCSPLOWO2_01_FULL_39_10b]